ncbi:hypothetical protein QN277_004181 [Acacia crassicarpa]|uniref:Uncharacterized protein n=1 Tax=Acacia crassicarpa TaxID=499986 RepID=A0AAE1JXG5_9FABA|nr:hypothetical protein QN277_004181 [Acacia crassicarpa]
MESSAPKRPRPQEEEEVNSEESLKRQKPYNQIISLLESEEDESPEDLSPLITTLQQEINSSSDETLLAPPARPAENSQTTVVHPETQQQQQLASETPFTTTSPVMRHLLEASDDELGIPNSKGWDFGDYDDGLFSSSFMNNNEAEDINGFASLCDGLWELEDETANYYTLLQSQLFL